MRNVLVTGGSRGIGLAIARKLAGNGYDVIAVARRESQELRDEILADCRAHLASHKVPAVIRFVEALDVTPAGKLARSDA